MGTPLAKFTPTIEQVSADARGEIYSITLPGDREFLLIHSIPGSLRGGHAHTTDEVVVMVAGKMKYRKRFPEAWKPEGAEMEFILEAGRETANWKGVFHMGEFLEDSWLVEIKADTKKGGSQNIDYAPWRQKVTANAAGR